MPPFKKKQMAGKTSERKLGAATKRAKGAQGASKSKSQSKSKSSRTSPSSSSSAASASSRSAQKHDDSSMDSSDAAAAPASGRVSSATGMRDLKFAGGLPISIWFRVLRALIDSADISCTQGGEELQEGGQHDYDYQTDIDAILRTLTSISGTCIALHALVFYPSFNDEDQLGPGNFADMVLWGRSLWEHAVERKLQALYRLRNEHLARWLDDCRRVVDLKAHAKEVLARLGGGASADMENQEGFGSSGVMLDVNALQASIKAAAALDARSSGYSARPLKFENFVLALQSALHTVYDAVTGSLGAMATMLQFSLSVGLTVNHVPLFMPGFAPDGGLLRQVPLALRNHCNSIVTRLTTSAAFSDIMSHARSACLLCPARFSTVFAFGADDGEKRECGCACSGGHDDTQTTSREHVAVFDMLRSEVASDIIAACLSLLETFAGETVRMVRKGEPYSSDRMFLRCAWQTAIAFVVERIVLSPLVHVEDVKIRTEWAARASKIDVSHLFDLSAVELADEEGLDSQDDNEASDDEHGWDVRSTSTFVQSLESAVPFAPFVSGLVDLPQTKFSKASSFALAINDDTFEALIHTPLIPDVRGINSLGLQKRAMSDGDRERTAAMSTIRYTFPLEEALLNGWTSKIVLAITSDDQTSHGTVDEASALAVAQRTVEDESPFVQFARQRVASAQLFAYVNHTVRRSRINTRPVDESKFERLQFLEQLGNLFDRVPQKMLEQVSVGKNIETLADAIWAGRETVRQSHPASAQMRYSANSFADGEFLRRDYKTPLLEDASLASHKLGPHASVRSRNIAPNALLSWRCIPGGLSLRRMFLAKRASLKHRVIGYGTSLDVVQLFKCIRAVLDGSLDASTVCSDDALGSQSIRRARRRAEALGKVDGGGSALPDGPSPLTPRQAAYVLVRHASRATFATLLHARHRLCQMRAAQGAPQTDLTTEILARYGTSSSELQKIEPDLSSYMRSVTGSPPPVSDPLPSWNACACGISHDTGDAIPACDHALQHVLQQCTLALSMLCIMHVLQAVLFPDRLPENSLFFADESAFEGVDELAKFDKSSYQGARIRTGLMARQLDRGSLPRLSQLVCEFVWIRRLTDRDSCEDPSVDIVEKLPRPMPGLLLTMSDDERFLHSSTVLDSFSDLFESSSNFGLLDDAVIGVSIWATVAARFYTSPAARSILESVYTPARASSIEAEPSVPLPKRSTRSHAALRKRLALTDLMLLVEISDATPLQLLLPLVEYLQLALPADLFPLLSHYKVDDAATAPLNDSIEALLGRCAAVTNAHSVVECLSMNGRPKSTTWTDVLIPRFKAQQEKEFEQEAIRLLNIDRLESATSSCVTKPEKQLTKSFRFASGVPVQGECSHVSRISSVGSLVALSPEHWRGLIASTVAVCSVQASAITRSRVNSPRSLPEFIESTSRFALETMELILSRNLKAAQDGYSRATASMLAALCFQIGTPKDLEHFLLDNDETNGNYEPKSSRSVLRLVAMFGPKHAFVSAPSVHCARTGKALFDSQADFVWMADPNTKRGNGIQWRLSLPLVRRFLGLPWPRNDQYFAWNIPATHPDVLLDGLEVLSNMRRIMLAEGALRFRTQEPNNADESATDAIQTETSIVGDASVSASAVDNPLLNVDADVTMSNAGADAIVSNAVVVDAMVSVASDAASGGAVDTNSNHPLHRQAVSSNSPLSRRLFNWLDVVKSLHAGTVSSLVTAALLADNVLQVKPLCRDSAVLLPVFCSEEEYEQGSGEAGIVKSQRPTALSQIYAAMVSSSSRTIGEDIPASDVFLHRFLQFPSNAVESAIQNLIEIVSDTDKSDHEPHLMSTLLPVLYAFLHAGHIYHQLSGYDIPAPPRGTSRIRRGNPVDSIQDNDHAAKWLRRRVFGLPAVQAAVQRLRGYFDTEIKRFVIASDVEAGSAVSKKKLKQAASSDTKKPRAKSTVASRRERLGFDEPIDWESIPEWLPLQGHARLDFNPDTLPVLPNNPGYQQKCKDAVRRAIRLWLRCPGGAEAMEAKFPEPFVTYQYMIRITDCGTQLSCSSQTNDVLAAAIDEIDISDTSLKKNVAHQPPNIDLDQKTTFGYRDIFGVGHGTGEVKWVRSNCELLGVSGALISSPSLSWSSGSRHSHGQRLLVLRKHSPAEMRAIYANFYESCVVELEAECANARALQARLSKTTNSKTATKTLSDKPASSGMGEKRTASTADISPSIE